MTNSENQKLKRAVQGVVVSNKMNKTAVVLVERKVKHAVTGKYIMRSSKIHAHDNENACQICDIVMISECSPISKTKSWVVVDIVKNK